MCDVCDMGVIWCDMIGKWYDVTWYGYRVVWSEYCVIWKSCDTISVRYALYNDMNVMLYLTVMLWYFYAVCFHGCGLSTTKWWNGFLLGYISPRSPWPHYPQPMTLDTRPEDRYFNFLILPAVIFKDCQDGIHCQVRACVCMRVYVLVYVCVHALAWVRAREGNHIRHIPQEEQ